MTHHAYCSIWRSSWHFNSLLQWFYSTIRYSYHTYTRIPFQVAVRFGSCPLHCSLSDRYLSVCQTFAPNSRNGQPLIRHSRIADRPTPDVSAVRLSAINIKPLISSIKILSSIFHYSLLMEILSSQHHSFTCLRCRTILNCLTWPNRFIAPIIHTYFAHDNWSMCALRPEW